MRKCAICGKKSIWGRRYKKLISKYNPMKMEKKYPNLQWVRLPARPPKFYKGKSWQPGKRVLACTSCIKTLYKVK